MAVAIPLLLSATGASAAIAGAVGIAGLTAGMVTTIATVAFAVTGISDKINKAAEGVFGKNLTMIGNIFGAAYGSFGGGFSGAAEAATGAGGLNAVDGADLASDLFTKAGTSGAGEFGSLASMGGAAESIDAINGLESASDAAMGASQSSGMASMAPSQTLSPMVSGGQDLLNTGGINGAEMAAVEQAQAAVAPVQTTAMSGQGAAGQTAAAAVATAPQQSAAGSGASAAVNAPPAVNEPPAGGRSFFDKLVFDEKGNVSKTAFGALEGVGKGISAASAASTLAKQKREQYDRELAERQRKTNQRTGLRVTG